MGLQSLLSCHVMDRWELKLDKCVIWKVRGSTKSIGFILWEALMSIWSLIAISKILKEPFDSGPNVWPVTEDWQSSRPDVKPTATQSLLRPSRALLHPSCWKRKENWKVTEWLYFVLMNIKRNLHKTDSEPVKTLSPQTWHPIPVSHQQSSQLNIHLL